MKTGFYFYTIAAGPTKNYLTIVLFFSILTTVSFQLLISYLLQEN